MKKMGGKMILMKDRGKLFEIPIIFLNNRRL